MSRWCWLARDRFSAASAGGKIAFASHRQSTRHTPALRNSSPRFAFLPRISPLPLVESAPVPGSAAPPNLASVVLAVITFCGAWLRISCLGSKSLWLDEGATVALARASWQHFAWVWWHGEANLQTIYFLLMRAWIHLGSGEAFLRLPSAIFGIARDPGAVRRGAQVHRRVGVAGGCGAAGLQPQRGLLLAGGARLHAGDIDGAGVDVLLRARRRRRPYARLGAVDAEWHGRVLLPRLHRAGAGRSSGVVLVQGSTGAVAKGMVVGGALIFLAAVPGLTYVFRASPENLHFVWMPSPSLKESWHLAMFFGGSGLKVALSLVLWIAGLTAVIRARRNGAINDYWRGMLLVLWAVVPPVLLALISLRQPMFLQRYVFFSLPAALLLAAIGAGELSQVAFGARAGRRVVRRRCSLGGKELLPSPRRLARREPAGAQLGESGRCGGVLPVLHAHHARLLHWPDCRRAGSARLRASLLRRRRRCAEFAAGAGCKSARVPARVDPHGGSRVRSWRTSTTALRPRQSWQRLYGQPTVYRFADVDVLEYGK